MMALTPETLSTAIDRLYTKKLKENFFLGTMLWKFMSENEDPVSGGRQIVDQISYTNSPNAGAWGGGIQQLKSGFVGHMTEAVHDPVFYYFSIAVPETDEIMNSDPADIINIVEAQTELAEMSLRDTMGSDIYSDGSVNSDGFRRLSGFDAIITTGADPTPGAYAGISRIGSSGSRKNPTGEAAWWNANPVAINANGSVTRWKGSLTFGNTTALDLASLQKAFSFNVVNGIGPNLITCDQLSWNAYYGLVLDQVRQASSEDVGKQGFTGLTFNNCPLIQDDAVPTAGTFYFINTRFAKLRPYKRGNFRMTGWRQPADQLVNLKYGIWMGNVTCTRPNMLGKLTAITG